MDPLKKTAFRYSRQKKRGSSKGSDRPLYSTARYDEPPTGNQWRTNKRQVERKRKRQRREANQKWALGDHAPRST